MVWIYFAPSKLRLGPQCGNVGEGLSGGGALKNGLMLFSCEWVLTLKGNLACVTRKWIWLPLLSVASLHAPACPSASCFELKKLGALNRCDYPILDFPSSRTVSQSKPLLFIKCPLLSIVL
jgi:hypothetical protein